jgi:murein DD-endopeptidase MepM/ murein hydrolase activator NlpD
MLLVVGVVAGSIVMGGPARRTPSVRRFVVEQLAAVLAVDTPLAAGTAEPTLSGGLPLALLRTPTTAPAVAPRATATPRNIPTIRPLDQIRRDHFWLARPVAAPGDSRVARYYPYGSRQDGSYPVHYGVEMVNAEGTPVLAPSSGVIVAAGMDTQVAYGARPGFYGQLVVLQLDQRYQGAPVYVLFGHLSSIQVAVGQPVAAGQAVGAVGATGIAEGAHLHSEVRIGKNDYRNTVNPELWYKPREGCGTLAGVLLDGTGLPVDTETRMVISSSYGVYDVFTYPLDYVNPDPEWTENYGIGDLEAGTWTLEVFYRGVLYTEEVQITAGETTWLAIRTE